MPIFASFFADVEAKARVEVVDGTKKRDLEIIGGGGHRGELQEKRSFLTAATFSLKRLNSHHMYEMNSYSVVTPKNLFSKIP